MGLAGRFHIVSPSPFLPQEPHVHLHLATPQGLQGPTDRASTKAPVLGYTAEPRRSWSLASSGGREARGTEVATGLMRHAWKDPDSVLGLKKEWSLPATPWDGWSGPVCPLRRWGLARQDRAKGPAASVQAEG